MGLLLSNQSVELPHRSEQADREVGHEERRNKQEPRQGGCLVGFQAGGRTAAVQGKPGPLAGWVREKSGLADG